MSKQQKVIVGMSGGVDSSVAAYLLKQHHYDVEGLFMKNWEEDDTKEYCGSAADFADAQSVCNTLNIKLHSVNFASEFWNDVFKYVLTEYAMGRTPNPDILCNKEIKFKTFLKFAIECLNADYIATGHYVRRISIHGRNQILRGIDNNKDQSYFLYTLCHEQIALSLFPLGNMKKSVVRTIAERLNLVTAKKKDSTGICFIGKRKFRKFLERYLPTTPGKIVTIHGDEIGKHYGIAYYTLGQRRGLGIGGTKKGNKEPWYVVDKEIKRNIIIVAQGRQHPCLMSIGLIAHHLHWIDYHQIIKMSHCTVKIRYQQDDIPCTIISLDNAHIEIRFDNPVSAVTPGQSAVFYNGDICLGGGIIIKRLPLVNITYTCNN